MGWRRVDAYAHTIQWCGRWVDGDQNPIETATEFPNYPEDLNAMCAAETKLRGNPGCGCDEWLRYVDVLKCIVLRDCKSDVLGWIKASAAQRAEALCKILWPSKWNEYDTRNQYQLA